jgi:hypothetical protein
MPDGGLRRPFEAVSDEASRPKIEGIVREELDLEQDQVSIYRLCSACAGRPRLHGPSLPVPEEGGPQVF